MVCSMSAIAFDTDGCETASRSAALPMLPSSATVSRTCRSCNFSRRPIRSSHFIDGLQNVLQRMHIDIRLCAHQKKELFVYLAVGYRCGVNFQRSPPEEGINVRTPNFFGIWTVLPARNVCAPWIVRADANLSGRPGQIHHAVRRGRRR